MKSTSAILVQELAERCEPSAWPEQELSAVLDACEAQQKAALDLELEARRQVSHLHQLALAQYSRVWGEPFVASDRPSRPPPSAQAVLIRKRCFELTNVVANFKKNVSDHLKHY